MNSQAVSPNSRPQHWPAHLPTRLTVPETNLFFNAEVSAARFPDKPFLVFYGRSVSFSMFKEEAERIAGFLQHHCGVRAGDRVLLYSQNCPQWAIAYYAILRANAVVVPVNPMNTTEEMCYYVEDSEARTIIVAQELYARVWSLLEHPEGGGLEHALVVTYSDYIPATPDAYWPDFITAPCNISGPGVSHWRDAIAAAKEPGPLIAGPDDLCVMPYTSGTTGRPKGCMHTHRSVMCTALGGVHWFGSTQDSIQLAVLPLFHVTGMQGGLNAPLYSGATVVMLARWDRDAAAKAIQQHSIAGWNAISTMVADFLANPQLDDYNLSALRWIRGGGAAMPVRLVRRLKARLDLDYIEGYGMSETTGATHINPAQRPKAQCLGIPVFDIDARIVDPATLAPLPQGEAGEIVVHGPQVMLGYWHAPEGTRNALVEIDGKIFLRTGDLGFVDEDGYFFMTDRLKRMINASGYKVWPAEVEAALYRHPAVHEVCVIAAHDDHRGETVKALVVLTARAREHVSPTDIIAWARQNMAAYKVPRVVEFLEALPKSGTGKVMWRQLQEEEAIKATRRDK
ncbi:long-chain fatty acid--CoA ligase [Paraburkholderia caribensis]|uniref:long-chain fatty acid--CoA ligase n=1 Tax=Paraburkholderia caribensis TaxID=75105 RepID=UPI000720F6FB|nr:long-chain fatty acid--CoA ligase [Paraburkholderia caribensis]ALP68758.1 long-chain fatty acid--CoA ligase [Paraburkholderia caribensis]AUT58117.1 long-chain fatty acid--CoA ligase [Paraburkholderia caribensis]